MTLPTVPPIDMHMICDEFQVPRDTPLASFRRGAGIVPDTPGNANVPTVLPITMLDLLGASRQAPINIVNLSEHGFALAESGNRAYAYTSVDNDGKQRVSTQYGAQLTVFHTWLNAGVASDYRFRGTLVSGNVTGGSSFGVWQTGLAWYIERLTLGVQLAEISVQCAHKDDLNTILDTCTFNLSATIEN